MGEHLKRIYEARRMKEPVPLPAPDFPPPVPPATDRERQSLQAEHDRVQVRLGELQKQAAFGGTTPADRSLIGAYESRISLLDGRLTAPPVEHSQKINRRILSAFRALLSGKA